jgi:hypothetical protein
LGILLRVLGRLTANHIANRGVLYKVPSVIPSAEREPYYLDLTEKGRIANIAEIGNFAHGMH